MFFFITVLFFVCFFFVSTNPLGLVETDFSAKSTLSHEKCDPAKKGRFCWKSSFYYVESSNCCFVNHVWLQRHHMMCFLSAYKSHNKLQVCTMEKSYHPFSSSRRYMAKQHLYCCLGCATAAEEMETQLRSVQMDVVEKTERTSKFITSAIDVIEADRG